MCCKAVIANFFAVLVLLVKPSIYIENQKGSLEAYLSIMWPPIIVASSSPVIPPSLPSSFFFSSMPRSNSRRHQIIGWQWITVESYVINSSDLCRMRITTGKMKCMSSRNFLSVIDLIKERYVIFWSPSISWKRIIEAIRRKLFREFSDTNQFLIVISLNPIRKSFPKNINSHCYSYCFA